MLVSIIGESQASQKNSDLAEELGSLLAKSDFTIVTGGIGGVIESVSKGTKKYGGTTIGILILPDLDPSQANKWAYILIWSGLGDTRNLIVDRAGFAVIAIGGAYGTLSEIGHALYDKKPLISLNSWRLIIEEVEDMGMIMVKTPDEALNKVLFMKSSNLSTGWL